MPPAGRGGLGAGLSMHVVAPTCGSASLSLPGPLCSGDYSAVCDHNCRGACPARSEIRQVQATLAPPFALRPPHNSSEPR